MNKARLTTKERSRYHSLEDVLGCKWSVAVVAALKRGVSRPGQLERFIPGISTKVLNERLRKLSDYGLLTRTDHPGKALHVEYALSGTGQKLASVIEQIHLLQAEHNERAETP
jgi:DNA-binding HxlR family transcriptional regulator